MRRPRVGLLVSSLALLLGLAGPVPAEQRFIVTSRGLATLTVDGGRSHGLKVGDRLRVVSGAATIAELEVVSVAERWSECRTLSVTRAVTPGDVVVPAKRAPAPTQVPAPTVAPTKVPTPAPPPTVAPPPAPAAVLSPPPPPT